MIKVVKAGEIRKVKLHDGSHIFLVNVRPQDADCANYHFKFRSCAMIGPTDPPRLHNRALRVNFNGRHLHNQCLLSPTISTNISTLGVDATPMGPHSKAYSYLHQNILVTPIYI